MLGELIAETRGKTTGRRVLSTDGGLKMEVSTEDSGKFLGIDANSFLTFWAATRPDGSQYGEGHGVAMTADGESITWKGQGVGKPTRGGTVSYRGAVYYQTSSAKLARLNGVAGVFEFDVDANGNTHAKIWEWK